MAKTYSATKHLYTLNESKMSSSQNSAGNSSLNSSRTDSLNNYQTNRDFKKLSKTNQELKIKMQELQLKNQELLELQELSQRRNIKHEQKQRELIKKLSYFQVANKQLVLDLKKTSNTLIETKQHKKLSENHSNEIRQIVKKALEDKQRFIQFLKGAMEMIGRCDSSQQFAQEKNKVLSILHKNITQGLSNTKIQWQFDMKFELSRVDTLKERVKSLEDELLAAQQMTNRQKSQKKKLIIVYNEKIARLKQLYEGFKDRVQRQQEESKTKVKQLLNQKNEVIDNLRNCLKESRTRKGSIDVRKSRQSKKSFIGDGDLSHLQLTELNQAIQNLEMQIIQEFQE